MIFTTAGSVRGCCGHKHPTCADAENCLIEDQDGCHDARGYSDRIIVYGEEPDGILYCGDGEPYYPHGRTHRAASVDDIGGRL